MRWVKRTLRYRAVEPDEILIDAQNLPHFDTARLEGKIERPIESRVYRNLLLIIGALLVVTVSQLAKLQLVDHEALAARSEANRLEESIIFAERGTIVDRNHESLALNTPGEDADFMTRTYPLQDAAAHVVGYVSYPKKDASGFWYQTKTEGLFGIEALFDDRLVGSNGAEIQEVTASGDVVAEGMVRTAKHGEEVTLSLDAGVQAELYRAVKERSDQVGFVGGSGVIIDVASGELIALVSYPSFNPEEFASGDTKAVQRYTTDRRSPLLDRAVSGLYTPGSVVKPFVALAALEEGIIAPEKQILSTGSISIPNPYDPKRSTIFRDWKAHGWVDMRHALAHSSDVYFYAVGGGYQDQRGLGVATIERYMRLFGFGEATGVILPGEAAGVIPTPRWKAETFGGEQWFLGNTYHTAIGQYGFQVTVLQLVRAIAALANGGSLVAPTIVRGDSPSTVSTHVSKEHLEVVREGMRLAVTEGTAQALAVPGVTVAGKTGTAEVGAKKEFINSLVVGFFPYEKPRYAFAVVMERAKAGTTAGAPLAVNQLLTWLVANRPAMVAE